MRNAIPLLVTIFIAATALAQESKTPVLATPEATLAIKDASVQRAHLQQCAVQGEALQEAIKMLSAAKSDETRIAALRQLAESQQKDFQAAKETYATTLAKLKSSTITASDRAGSSERPLLSISRASVIAEAELIKHGLAQPLYSVSRVCTGLEGRPPLQCAHYSADSV